MDTLRVYLWGKEIGRLSWHAARRISYFTFNPAYHGHRLDISPFFAPVKNDRRGIPIFGQEGKKYQGLPPFIADSLPDAWGNELFERWRVSQHLSHRDVTPLHKLAFIGKRGMGALEFVPDIPLARIGRIDIGALAHLANKILADREEAYIAPDEELTMQALIAVGTSAGGRQPKAVIAINESTGEIRSGQVDTASDFSHYILKFNDPSRCTAEMELTYHHIALAAGISMMPSRFLEVENVRHFLTRRFDRDANGKLYTQTVSALWPEVISYEQVLAISRRLRLPETDCQEVFRRMVFNIIANNTDDHDKNFTFIMDRFGRWRLSPAYDLTFIFNYGGYQPEREHCLMARGKRCDFTQDDLLTFARENGIRHPQAIIREVASAFSDFPELAVRYGVRADVIHLVANGILGNLISLGLVPPKEELSYTDSDGRVVTSAKLTLAYKGNYHLSADIDGEPHKFVIRKGTSVHDRISDIGLYRVEAEELVRLIAELFPAESERRRGMHR